jgi:hypothetical protein
VAVTVFGQIGIAQELSIRAKTGAGEDNGLLFSSVAAVNGQFLGVEKIKHGVHHGRIYFRAIAARGNLHDMTDQSKHGTQMAEIYRISTRL